MGCMAGGIPVEVNYFYPLEGKVLLKLSGCRHGGIGLAKLEEDKFLDRTGIKKYKAEAQGKPGGLSESYFGLCDPFHLIAKLQYKGARVL